MSATSLPFPGVQTPYHSLESNIQDSLHGARAFYNQRNYLAVTRRDFLKHEALPSSYVWNTESKIIRIVKQIVSVLIFPIGTYQLLHSLVGKIALLPSASPCLMGCPANYVNAERSRIELRNEWKYKRITIEVDGYQIDAVIVGKVSTLHNGRWLLASNGNGEFYEEKLVNERSDFKRILTAIHGNGIVFNYPGVGASSGLPSRQAMAKAYCAMLRFLEDRQKGIGAIQIFGYGHSIGGGVQGDALETHPLQKDVQYVFIKSRTFSDLSTTVSSITNKPLGFLIKLLGWNMSSVESSKKLQSPEIILQTARVPTYGELADSSSIIGDGVIPADASLAKALLDDPECPRAHKLFLGIRERHNEEFRDPSFLAEKIEAFLTPRLAEESLGISKI